MAKETLTLAPLIKQKFALPLPELSAAAERERDQLVIKAQAVTTIADAQQNKLAGLTVVELRNRVKAVKASRKKFTAPLDTATKQLIQIERDYCGPLEEQIERIEKAANAFQDAEDKRVEKEEQERADALKKLDDEKRAAEAKLEDANKRNALKIEAKIEAIEQQFQAVVRTDAAVAVKAQGQQRRNVLHVEVVDKRKAFAAMPHCFDIVEKKAVLNACCIPAADKNEANKETELYPGIVAWWSKETTFSSR